MQETANIVIIGGGVMGVSTAYHLAARGVRDIVLLEKEDFYGTGATGRCAGGVRYQFSTAINIRLSLESLPMLERFEEEIGYPVDYRQCGYLFVLTRPEDVRLFERNVALQHQLGVMTEWLDGDEIRRRLPLMRFEDALGGTFYPKDGLVDPNGVVQGYLKAAQRLGVKAYSGRPVIGINSKGGRIQGVETPAGSLACETIINAAGPWAGEIGRMVDVSIPISPIRRQWLTTTPLPEIPADFPFVIDFAQSLYFHRESNGLLSGMSNPDEAPGFHQYPDLDWELTHMTAATERMPLLEKAGVTGRVAGLYEVTPDAHPIFGATPVEGFYVVAGFSGHGFMHGPIAGKLMAEILLDGQAHSVDVSGLDLARFETGRLIHEQNVV